MRSRTIQFGLALGTLSLLFGACNSSDSSTRSLAQTSSVGGSTHSNCGLDFDEDGYCDSLGSSSSNFDCDDFDAARHPGVPEVLNAVDDDCDGVIDDGLVPECALTLTTPPGGCETAIDLVAGSSFACVLTSAGRVLCWGKNYSGALGVPHVVNVSVPVAVAGLSGAKALVSSAAAVCALREADAVCWGGRAAFPFIAELPQNTTEIAIGYTTLTSGQYAYTLYALDGTGQTWARDFVSAGGVAPSFAKVQSGVKRLVGGGAACAITTTDSLICNLGPQATTISTKVDYATNGVDGALCYITGGALYCSNGGTQGTLVEGNGSAAGVAVSSRLGCAFNAAGKLACWKSEGPTTVEDAADLAVGTTFGCVLRASGRVSCWGNADGGQLGDGRVSPSISAREPVDVLPGPTQEFPSVILLGPNSLGACDSAQDVAVLTKTPLELHSALVACKAECQNRLDTADCFASCATNPGLSAGCFGCYVGLAECSGTDCYATFNACAGYPVDFAYAVSNIPRFECDGATCLHGAGTGQPCSSSSDCLSGSCNKLPQAPNSTVCVAADGVSCSTGSAYCTCKLGTDESSYSGHCGSCYGEGRVLLTRGSCERECWEGGGYCAVGQNCEIFSNSLTEGYCE